MRVRTRRTIPAAGALAAMVAAVAAIVVLLGWPQSARPGAPVVSSAVQPAARQRGATALAQPVPVPARTFEPVVYRDSRAVGRPTAGRLVNGTNLPEQGLHFFTWDPERKRSPNPIWRRYATDRLIRVVLRVAEEFALAHPEAARLAIGDLSRPRGGRFPKQGSTRLMHVSHQNGLDADIYYPRLDHFELAPFKVREVDRALSQDLVDRFVRAGAQYVFVGPRSKLTGPRRIVQVLRNHDNHLHVRLRPR